METEISGLVNSGLVMAGEAGALQKLRRLLVDLILSDLDIKHEMPPADVLLREHRDAMLNMMVPTEHGSPYEKRANKVRQYILRWFFNGWINESKIVHYCTPDCCRNPLETRKNVYMFVAWACIPKKLPVLSRKGWFNQTESVQWAGALEAHHGLFTRLMLKFIGAPQQQLVESEAGPDGGQGADFWSCALEDAIRENSVASSFITFKQYQLLLKTENMNTEIIFSSN